MKLTTMRMLAVLLSLGLWSCAGDETSTQEPVDEKPPVIPDMPGDAGETGEKPAGDAGTKESVEKSQPNVEAAKGKKTSGSFSGPMYVTQGVNVRGGPGMKFPVARTLKKGEKVQVSGCEGVWCAIGEKEYVSKTFLSSQALK